MSSLGLFQVFSGSKLFLISMAALVFTLVFSGLLAGSRFSNRVSLLILFLFSVLWTFITGAYAGTLVSSQMIIPWYGFGIAVNFVCFACGYLVIRLWPQKYGSEQAFAPPPLLTSAGNIGLVLYVLSISYGLVRFFDYQSVGVTFYAMQFVFNISFIAVTFGFLKARPWAFYSLMIMTAVYVTFLGLYAWLLRGVIVEWSLLKYAYMTLIPVVIMHIAYVRFQLLVKRFRASQVDEVVHEAHA